MSLQLDVTATPKHNNGAIFVADHRDYPLVEAISQNVVKHAGRCRTMPRARGLTERQSVEIRRRSIATISIWAIWNGARRMTNCRTSWQESR